MSTPSMEQVSRAAVDSGYWEHDEVARALAAHDAEVRADERAKRPDREQIARALARVRHNHAYAEMIECQNTLVWRDYLREADAVLSSLALEPEAREEPSECECGAPWCSGGDPEAREVTDAERVESAAKVLYDDYALQYDIAPWETVDRRPFLDLARAALEAAREVSHGS